VDQGLAIVSGDMRVIDPDITIGPGGAPAVATPDMLILDQTESWHDEYGENWFQVAMEYIGGILGIGPTTDLPSPTEPVFPTIPDIIHGQYLYRPESNDIDVVRFELAEAGVFTAETVAERQADSSLLDTVVSLYAEEAGGARRLVARNDDYFSEDSWLQVELDAGTYYVAVSASGNDQFDPNSENTGFGGTSEGLYDLWLDFEPHAVTALVDLNGAALDGDGDGRPGGECNFWFHARSISGTIFVDKSNPSPGDGSLGNPYASIQDAITAAGAVPGGDVIRMTANGGADGDLSTLADNLAYEFGLDSMFRPLADGVNLEVPQDTTIVVDPGAVFKLRRARIGVGSSGVTVDRSGGALQVLGTPEHNVVFTSWNDESIGFDTNPVATQPAPGDWGGLVFQNDLDRELGRFADESEGIFLDHVAYADIRYGGGLVRVDSVQHQITPIHIIDARPSVWFSRITLSEDAAMAATPNSFEETRFHASQYQADSPYTPDYVRVGPDLRGNVLSDNAVNGLFVQIDTAFGAPLTSVTVPTRWDDADIVHVLTEPLTIDGTPGGAVLDPADGHLENRLDGRLAVDPGVIVKLSGGWIEAKMGAQVIAEGREGRNVVFTSIDDDRFGADGPFDTVDGSATPSVGDWGGIYAGPTASLNIDHATLAFGGGAVALEGGFSAVNPVEIHQARARVANSRFEQHASGFLQAGPPDRVGRGTNESATVFVRGAQPIVYNNLIAGCAGPAINIDVASLNHHIIPDSGRTNGLAERVESFDDNHGPLVRENRLDGNGTNGMKVRGGTLTGQSIWDDTDIVHVVTDSIVVPNFHTYGGLRLESSPSESLVVKLSGPDAGFTATGTPLDIDDRIGGSLHVVGIPPNPVFLTSLADDTVGAGWKPDGSPQTDTNGDGSASQPQPGDWRSIRLEEYSHDRNVELVLESEVRSLSAPGTNATTNTAEYLGELSPNEKSGSDIVRLGFEVHGLLNEPGDVDMYAFRGEAGTEVWLDIDRTSSGLDTVIEFVDGDGVVLARSDNSTAEASGAETLYSSGLLMPSAAPFAGRDVGASNIHDAGMRLVLPGPPGERSNWYHVRVRSSSPNLDDLSAGLTSGVYQLQVRIRETNEVPGSTVRYADIRYPTNGIEALGLPVHSPLVGEASETDASNNTIATAQALGNVLETDRAAISLAGNLDTPSDIDWYDLGVEFKSIAGDGGPASLVFDMDYADDTGRPDTMVAVFDVNGQLVLMADNSNIADDRSRPEMGMDQADLTRGTVGEHDPFLGPVELPESTYYVAVASAQYLPDQLVSNAAVRREPVNSVVRIAEDHIGSYGGSTADDPVVTDLLDPTFAGTGTNLWHVSTREANTSGHGLTAPFDGSRAADASGGGNTFYFGNEDTGTYDLGLGNVAGGNLLSNPFSLKAYSAADRPALYFNYKLDADNMDEFRVRVVKSDGSDVPVTSNSMIEFSPPHLMTDDNVWRQMRVELDDFAGLDGLKIRFDFQAADDVPGDSEGVHIDDVIIGFAERGEMVTGASAGATGFTLNPETPETTVFDGAYQLEVRRSTEYAYATDTGLSLTRTFDTNDRLTQAVSIVAPAGDQIIDGQTFSISDGVNVLAFEYDQTSLGNGVMPGNVSVPFEPTDDDATIAQRIADTLNSPAVRSYLDVTSAHVGSGPRIDVFGWAEVNGIDRVFHDAIGDTNRFRDQGQLLIQSNYVRNASDYGIRIEAGTRDGAGLAPHPGPVRNLPELNVDRVIHGAMVVNNAIVGVGNGAIYVSSDPATSGTQLGPVRSDRFMNNTLYGSEPVVSATTGIAVDKNSSPTILNTIVSSFGTGISIDATSGTTVTGGNLYHNNETDSTAAMGFFDLSIQPNDPLFVDPANGNFYLDRFSSAIDSGIQSLQDRPGLVQVKNAIGIASTPIVPRRFDLGGRLFIDDPDVDTPSGMGANVYTDRGALDRADFAPPQAALMAPVDNGPGDLDPADNVVRLDGNTLLAYFSIELFELSAVGTGPDPATVITEHVSVSRDGVPLSDGVDYAFDYEPATGLVRLDPVANVWRPGTYVITLDNTKIHDRAKNLLLANQLSNETQFTIHLEADVGGAASGGGIFGDSGTIDVSNTIVADNTSTGISPDAHGNFNSLGNNLVGDVGAASGFTDGTNGDIAGSAAALADPKIGVLQSNGGTTKTHALAPDSPAVDRGGAATALATDQRGVSRPQDGDHDTTPTADIGAVELFYSSILGTVFGDDNANDVKDAAELALAGWTVFLDLNENGQPEATEPAAVTGVDGSFALEQVEPSTTYAVALFVPQDWEQTYPDAPAHHSVTPLAGQTVANVNFGARLARGEIRGRVFHDINGDTVKNPGEPGIENRVISLDSGVQVSTDAEGHYVFEDVAPGIYTVRSAFSSGWSQTFPLSTHQVEVGPGRVVDDINFANQRSIGGVGADGVIEGKVFDDLNGNRRHDPGEPVREGTIVYLDLNENGEFDDTEPSRPSDQDGNYIFDGLDPDTYLVGVHIIDDTLTQTLPQTTGFSETRFTTGDAPVSVVSGDFTGDERRDLAVLNSQTSNVSVLKSAGWGDFTEQAIRPGVGLDPSSIVAAHFTDDNGDGVVDQFDHLDMAVTNVLSGDVSILLGNGDGTFSSGGSAGVGAAPSYLAAGHLNGDGYADLVVTNLSAGTVSVLLNNRDGTFQPQQDYFTGDTTPGYSLPASVAIAKLDGDSLADIAVANSATDDVSILINEGGGSFGNAFHYPAGKGVGALTVVDLVGDEQPDVAVTNALTRAITVLPNNGDGSLGDPRPVYIDFLPTSVAHGDVDDDGDADLVASDGNIANVSVLLNRGDDRFEVVSAMGGVANFTMSFVSAFSVDDVTGDGVVDLALVSGESDNEISVLVGDLHPGAHVATITAEDPDVDTIHFGIQQYNALPTLKEILDPTEIEEDAGQQTIQLQEISPGDTEAQPLRLTVTSSNPALIPTPQVHHTAGTPTGTLTYQPVKDRYGQAMITVTVTDGGLDGDLATETGNKSYSTAFVVTVTSVNDAPSSENDAFSTDEDTELEIPWTMLFANDEDIDSPADGWSITTITDEAHATVTRDETTRSLAVVPAQDFHGDATFIYTLDDGHGGTDTATVTVTVDAVNDAPREITLDTATVMEGDSGVLIGTLTVVDPDAGDTHAIDVVDDFRFEIVGRQLRLKSGVSLDHEDSPTVSVDVRATDSATPPESLVQSLNVSVGDKNEFAPVVDDQVLHVAENSSGGTPVGTVAATDDDTSQMIAFAITSGNTQGLFTIDVTTGQIRLTDGHVLDHEAKSQYELTVAVNDDVFPIKLDTARITVVIDDENEFAPVASDATFSIAEDKAGGTFVGQVQATDSDTSQSLSFAITAGNINDAFAIDTDTGQISIADSATLDREAVAQYTLTVTVTDNVAPTRSDTASVTVNVTDVNESPPVASDAVFNISENATGGTDVGTVTVTDLDATKPFRFEITEGNTGDAFDIDALTGRITVSSGSQLDRELTPKYTLTVKVTDQLSPFASDTATIIIDINDENEFGPDAQDDTFAVDEDAAPDSVVGTVIAHDADSSSTLVFEITGGNTEGAFAINSSTGVITVAADKQLDHETAATYDLVATATEEQAPYRGDTATIRINVNDVNEFDPMARDATFGMAEDEVGGTFVGQVQATDADTSQTLSFSVTAGNTGEAFAINANTGHVSISDGAQLDHEAVSEYQLTVTVTDNVDPVRSDTATVTVNVEDVNEFDPVFDNATFTVNENSAARTIAGTVQASDQDTSQTLDFAIAGEESAKAFVIDHETGQITVANDALLDRESKPQYVLTVTATDSLEPKRSGAGTVTINVADVNERPVVEGTISGQQAEENQPFDFTFVGDVFADVDNGDTLAFAAAQADSSPLPAWLGFNGSTRTFAGTPILFDRGVIDVKVTATDTGGLKAETTFSITIAEDTTPWRNPIDPMDVNDAEGATALDVLLVINFINKHGVGPLPVPISPSDVEGTYVDANSDNIISAHDVLMIINYINAQSASGEGEADGTTSLAGQALPDFLRTTVGMLADPYGQNLIYAHPGASTQQTRMKRSPASAHTVWRDDENPTWQYRANDRSEPWQTESDDWEDILVVLARDVAPTTAEGHSVDALFLEITDELEDSGGHSFQR